MISAVDNHIRSYEDVIAYMDVRMCRYQGTTIHEYPVTEVDVLRKFKDSTLTNVQARTARTKKTPKKYPAAPEN